MKKSELETPELVINLDQLETNIQRVSDIAKTAYVKLRPHVKTHKCPVIAHKQLDAGAEGVTVAKLGEAEVMSAAGIKDIFIAYEIVGHRKIERLLNLAQQTRVSVGVDSVQAARPLSQAFQGAFFNDTATTEIYTGLGRCGVPPLKPTLELAKQLGELSGLHLKGIFTHEGHASHSNTLEEVKRVSRQVGQVMVDTSTLLQRAGIEIDVVSVGSTPTVMAGDIVEGITEIRPGTYVFYDASGVTMGIVNEEDCAATVIATVISRPKPDRAIIDAGSKVLTVSKGRKGMGGHLPGYGLIKGVKGAVIENLNEEHGFVSLSKPDRAFTIGDQVEVIPYHICPVINLFNEMTGIRKDQVEVVWPVSARGKSK
jgi:D-serine deaminase-like pyridoxal phosphate-dependent protein